MTRHNTPVIVYRKELRAVCGSVNAALIFQQLEYWAEKKGGTFYKFLAPCEGHKHYKTGDSWVEEMGFSADEFRAAFDRIGKRYKSKKEYTEDTEGRAAHMYVSYTDKRSGLTYYVRNAELIHSKLAELTDSNKAEPIHSKQISPVSTNRDTQPQEIGNSNLQRLENPIPIITETTAEITRDYNTHTPRADNPITTAAPPDQYDLTPLAEPFLEYSKHVRPVNLATFDYSVRVALTKTSIQDLGDAIRQVAEKRKANPDDPERYYIRMSNLLNSPEKILEYAAEFRKSNAGGWAEDSEHNAKKVARMLKHSVPIPDEAKRHIPRAEKLLEARAV